MEISVKTPSKVRIGTYNLRRAMLDEGSRENNWSARRPRLIRSILDNDFDLCALQEVDSREQESIPHLLSLGGVLYGSFFFSPYAGDGKGTKAQGLIWKKDRFRMAGGPHWFWISDPPEKMQVNDLGPQLKDNFIRGGFCVVMEDKLSLRQYFVMVTHAPMNKSQHARGAHVFVEMEKKYNTGGLPSFFLGDFNACEEDEASAVYRRWWADSFHSFDSAPHLRQGPEGTFNGWRHGVPASRIDFIYYRGEGVCPVRYRCNDTLYDGMFASDHFPVWVEFNIE